MEYQGYKNEEYLKIRKIEKIANNARSASWLKIVAIIFILIACFCLFVGIASDLIQVSYNQNSIKELRRHVNETFEKMVWNDGKLYHYHRDWGTEVRSRDYFFTNT